MSCPHGEAMRWVGQRCRRMVDAVYNSLVDPAQGFFPSQLPVVMSQVHQVRRAMPVMSAIAAFPNAYFRVLIARVNRDNLLWQADLDGLRNVMVACNNMHA